MNFFFIKIAFDVWKPIKTSKSQDMRQLKITKQVTNRDTPSLDKYLQEIGENTTN